MSEPSGIPIEVASRFAAAVIISRGFAQVLPRYLACDATIQGIARDMAEIVNDPNATQDEQDRAIATIADALFGTANPPSWGQQKPAPMRR